MTPAELYDHLELVIVRAETRRWWRRRGPIVWFTAPTVTIDGHTWRARHVDTSGYGYTLAQARAMRRAVLPVLAEFRQALLELIAGHNPAQPR